MNNLKVKDIYVGGIYSSNHSGEFKIITELSKDKYRKRRYKIKFIKTGTTKDVCVREIINGRIKDRYLPSIYGVGYIGNAKKSTKFEKKIYNVWISILCRCYNLQCKGYKSYGAKEVCVTKEWHCFETFMKDIINLEGWDEELFLSYKLHLDKDKKQKNIPNKKYSKKTCIWVSQQENEQIKVDERNKWFKSTSPNKKTYYSNNIKQFALKYNLIPQCVNLCVNNKQKQHKGWKFEWIKEE